MGWEWMGEQKDAGAEKMPVRRDPGVRAGAKARYLGTHSLTCHRAVLIHDVHCPANLSDCLAPETPTNRSPQST